MHYRTTALPQTKIYVGNVEPHITTEMIKTVFEPFGMVVGAEMVVDPSNPGHVRGGGKGKRLSLIHI